METVRPRVACVVETEKEETAHEIGLRHALRALAKQTYPRALSEIIIVDSGKIPGLTVLVEEHYPGVRILVGTGLSEYQMKNLGVRESTGEIDAFTDGDCESRRDWIEQVVPSLGSPAPNVVGVQGRTTLRPGLFHRQVSALLYGLRTDASGTVSRRIISDNRAFRRDFIQQEPFEPNALPTTPDRVLLGRLTRQGLRIIVNEDMRSTHDFAQTEGLRGRAAMLDFFLPHAYSTGYCMMRVRSLVSGLRTSWVRRLGPVAPLNLVAGKPVADLEQISRNNRALGLTWRHWIAFSPLYVAYYVSHLVEGYAALLMPCGQVSEAPAAASSRS